MSKAKNYTEIAEGGYDGLTDSEIHLIAKEIGVKVHPAAKADLVKQRINEHLGLGVPDKNDEDKPKSNVVKIGKRSRLDQMPQMNGDGRWGGKMRKVRIGRQPDDPPTSNSYTVTWEGMSVVIPFDKEFDVPAPHYYRLRDNMATHEQPIEKNREDGEKYIEYRVTHTRVRAFDDLGWTKETEHLPDGKKDFLQQQARKYSNFAGLDRRELVRIHGILRNTTAPMLRDVRDEDIRIEILETLGPEFMDADEEDAA